MKEWVQNIEGLFKEGLTDVNFPADKWSGIASNSSLGMAIAAQQAPVGSVAYAMHEQHQLDMMLQASLSHMTPIQFGLSGYAHKSYPTYGPMMLGLGNLSPGDGEGELVQQVSGSADADMEELYEAIAKEAKRQGWDFSNPSAPTTYTAEEKVPYEGMRRVLGGNGPGTPDGLAPYATFAFDFFTEDLKTLADPNATAGEYFQAMGSFFIKPVKGLDMAADAVNKADDVNDVRKAGKGAGDAKDITKLTVDDIPTAKSGDFNKFFNSLTSSGLDELWKDKKIRKKLNVNLESLVVYMSGT